MHWFREGNRQQSRILYVFRTPGGVRVGRPALEADVLRQLEARHPEIEFDWESVLDNRQIVEPPSDLRRPRKRQRDDDAPAPPSAPPAAPAVRPEPPKPEPRPRFVVPGKIEGETPDVQVAFLEHWYALIREQVLQRATDPARREAIIEMTERLNPAAWTDADTITTGLQNAADALERLSRLFAKRRRRTRRSARPQSDTRVEPGSADAAAASADDAEVAASVDDRADADTGDSLDD
jgi:hypothetical protein